MLAVTGSHVGFQGKSSVQVAADIGMVSRFMLLFGVITLEFATMLSG